jgi:outer membrane protein assembly factor BamE (lipoprotein component of BamABCDE complex)
MNKINYLLMCVMAVALVGCASKTITSGREFDVAKIGDIQKGVTTSDQLAQLLGQPFSKAAQSADEVVWNYMWRKGTATTTHGSDGPVVTSQGEKKTLDVLIRNGVVENFSYKDGPFWNEQLKGSQ